MSDGLPTDEQLRRIELGVQRRIDARRRLARQVAGGAVAAMVLVGGFALLRPVIGTSASGAGSAASSKQGEFSASSAPAAGRALVRCHGAVTTTVTVDPAALPAAALTACAAAQRRTSAATTTDGRDGTAPHPSPSGAVLCEASDGSLSVWPGAVSVCRSQGLEPWSG